MISLPREDACCPACPDPETAFRFEDVGMKFETAGDYGRDDTVTFKVTRPAWEVVMLEHLRLTDDDKHRQLYGECMTALVAAGTSAEDSARSSVQAAVDSLRRSTDDPIRPPRPDALSLRPQLFTGISKRLAELTPWTERINAFNRRVLEENQ